MDPHSAASAASNQIFAHLRIQDLLSMAVVRCFRPHNDGMGAYHIYHVPIFQYLVYIIDIKHQMGYDWYI